MKAAHSRGNLTHRSQSKPVWNTLTRYGALQPSILSLRDIGQIRHRLAVVDRLGKRVASMKTEPVFEKLLYFPTSTAVDGEPPAVLYKAFTHLGEFSGCKH